MKLYLVRNPNKLTWGMYTSMVASAPNENKVREIHPDSIDSEYIIQLVHDTWTIVIDGTSPYPYTEDDWVSPENIDKLIVKYIGETEEPMGVILASYTGD